MNEIRSSEVKKAEQEVELSNLKLSSALDKLRDRTDVTLATLQRIRYRLRRAAHPMNVASEKASRSRAFAWTSVGLIGLLAGFGVKKAYDRYATSRSRRARVSGIHAVPASPTSMSVDTIATSESTEAIQTTTGGPRDIVSEY